MLHSICQQIRKPQPWPQDWKRSIFIPIPKRGNVKECSISVQSLSHAQHFVTTWTAACQASLSITNSWAYSNSCHWVTDAIQPSHPLSSSSPPASIIPNIEVFSNESELCIRWPKYWCFSFSISPSKEHLGLISFRVDCLDLLEVQGTLRIFCNTTVQRHQFFGVQLSL